MRSNDLEHVTRMRLACRTAENLILSDEVLTRLGTNWDALKLLIQSWLRSDTNAIHPKYADMQTFLEAGERKDAPVKSIRNVLLALTGYEHDWEVAVGKATASLTVKSSREEGSLIDFLGPKAVAALVGLAVRGPAAIGTQAEAEDDRGKAQGLPALELLRPAGP